MASRKEAFNEWIESVFTYLQERHHLSDMEIGTGALDKKSWWHLWNIFKDVENAKGSKELWMAYEETIPRAGDVILIAHDLKDDDDDLEFAALMREYNSDKYD